MEFRTFNTKNKKEYIYSENEIKDLFECDTRSEHFISQSELNYVIENPAEIFDEETLKEDLENYKKHWTETPGLMVCKDGEEFYKMLIEYETWTSPKGIEPVFRVIEVIK